MSSRRKSQVEEVVEEVEEVEEEGDDEEYEIEKIVQYKANAFQDPPDAGYKVKWKGYDTADNSWVRPADAVGAFDLIADFWKKKGKPNPHEHLRPAPSSDDEAAPEPPATEDADEDMQSEHTPEPAPVTKKRGRSSAAAAAAEPEKRAARGGGSVAREDAEAKKRGRKSTGTGSTSAPPPKKTKRSASPVAAAKEAKAPGEVDEEVVHPSKLPKFKNREDWSPLVLEITTIEQDKKRKNSKVLVCYFRLKGVDQICVEPVSVCRVRFTEKLLDFYEKNLRWRTIEGSDEEGQE